MAVIEVGSGGAAGGRGTGTAMATAYEVALHRLDDLPSLRRQLARTRGGARQMALRAVAGLHRAALREAVVVVAGPGTIDLRSGPPDAGIVTPAQEAELLLVLAAAVGLRPEDLPSLAQSRRRP
ncbi:MAG TPA: hypothetical protein VM264_12245 [Acidimicrobiales bacterium]|nr:hypothetical protein [Acidimicrobiales bacterium]